ncbi:ferric reductase-like transmembrane domain-containing protein [Eggerthella sp. YY7918]|uniref:ferric reductase-like transmembrane domain-containing protein n=1 Tax=Eggerthella sp. (strain YY7918) TaxID=502558 RepID=UPI000217148E|nr:ferric reductase-like transmembrane domain-containing protein [Eggerthella sp. YY7918]BAK45420.1 uncharacterized membrane protein [Eggerthella sp. YY7918]
MRFLIALVVAVAIIAACEKPLKRFPVLFYLLSLALVGVYFYGSATNATGGVWPYFLPLMQRCALAFVLFSAVMFIGVLGESSRLRAHLMPIRRQLSIMACIFAAGHIVYYAASYLPRLAATPTINVTFSLALALVLVVLMVVLLITSLLVVKQHLSAATWKGIQRLAYPFYALIYVHLALFLMPSAFAGKEVALVSLVVYTAIFASYAVLRLKKAFGHTASSPKPQQAFTK